MNKCHSESIFQENIGPTFDALMEGIFKDIDKKANKQLSDLQTIYPEVSLDRQQLDRILKTATTSAFSNALSPKIIANIKSKLSTPLPCNSKELNARLKTAPLRGIEDDLSLIIAYGYQFGLSQSDLALLPAKTITFEFHASPDKQTFELNSANLNISNKIRGQYLTSVRKGSLFVRSGERLEKVSSSKDELIKYIITLGVPLLFECLKWLWEELKDALKSDNKEEAAEALDDIIDKAEDILDDVEDDIDDIKDDIKELDEDIEDLEDDLTDEDDKEDRKEIKDEIEEKKKEKKAKNKEFKDKKEAEKKLEKGISRLKEARIKLR